MLKVIIGIELSLLWSRQLPGLPELPGKLLEAPGSPGSCREHESDNSCSIPGKSWKLPGRFLDAGPKK